MMRVSPLGIFAALRGLHEADQWARLDAEITHPNRVCVEVNALFAMALAYGISTGCDRLQLYRRIVDWAELATVDDMVLRAIKAAEEAPPTDFVNEQGWVLTAFQNALWQLVSAESMEEAVVDTVMRGGDTDTNAAICGALMGAVCGRAAIPPQWVEALSACRPEEGLPSVKRPRPQCYWPVDGPELAEQLVFPQRQQTRS
jgi:ADP-ribosylglycohydrolase